jgi:hypothetical protein
MRGVAICSAYEGGTEHQITIPNTSMIYQSVNEHAIDFSFVFAGQTSKKVPPKLEKKRRKNKNHA